MKKLTSENLWNIEEFYANRPLSVYNKFAFNMLSFMPQNYEFGSKRTENNFDAILGSVLLSYLLTNICS